MIPPELEHFRKELIQTAAVCAAIIEDIDTGLAHYDRPSKTNPEHYQGTDVILEISAERYRQDAKWGPQHHRIADWLSILGEEYGEACKAYNDDLLMPTILEQKRIGHPDLTPENPVKWGKSDPADYGTLTQVRWPGDPDVRSMQQIFFDESAARVVETLEGPDEDDREELADILAKLGDETLQEYREGGGDPRPMEEVFEELRREQEDGD